MLFYPDIEKTLVSHLQNSLGSGVYVATKKPAPDIEADVPTSQVVVNVAYSNEKEVVTRYAGVVLDIYAEDYATASNLAFITEGYLRTVVGDQIKKVEVLVGPVRVTEDGEQERRSISAELVVKGYED